MIPWDRPLTNIDIDKIMKWSPLKNIFRGSFSRDELIFLKPRRGSEAGIINLSNSYEKGTHWTSWFCHPSTNIVCYYNSFGDLPPPTEFVKYLRNCEIYYNVERHQSFNSVICGQLCLCFLYREFLSL